MPKNSKDVQIENGVVTRERIKKAARKKSSNKGGGSRRTKSAKSGTDFTPTVPSDEQIRMRAYFLAEYRVKHSIKGDHHGDWLEARRQLFEEAGIPLN